MPNTGLLTRPLPMPTRYRPTPVDAAAGDKALRLDLRSPRGPIDGSQKTAKSLLWEAYLGAEYIGYAGLEFAPAEFDLGLAQYGPAFRLYIVPKYRWRGLGSRVARAFIDQLRAANFSRPLLASHVADDEAAASILLQCGFLYTGCKSGGASGHGNRQMVAML